LQNPPLYLASIYACLGEMYDKLGRPPMATENYRKAIEHANTIEERESYIKQSLGRE
jgi:predicted RNA polymerase sigma factor